MNCNHILGLACSVGYEPYPWLVYSEDLEDEEYIGTYFKYCPLCGEKLEEEKQDD